MSDIFISYKREDEAPVARLVRALESAGHSVWWDRTLVAGENWRSQIQSALESARCVIVIWTEGSVGPAGDFVRDEAGHAKQRGVLVPVRFGNVNPPLGFGEIQAIDLTHWKGSAHDPFFKDLLDTVVAKMAGRAAPPAKAPMKRLLRRFSYGSLATSLVVAVALFGANIFHAQDRACSMPFLQPAVSDFCGTLGLGGKPSKRERVAWEKRQPGSCAALRAHLAQFPTGALRDEANGLLRAESSSRTKSGYPAIHQLALFESQPESPSSKKDAAQALAVAQAQSTAERLCRGFAATASFRFKSAKPVPQQWNCSSSASGVRCGFDGAAVCELEERSVQDSETCGK